MIFMREPTISAKPVGAWVGSQLWIAKAERSGLWTRTATTESGSLRVDEKLTAFIELQAATHRRFEAQPESHA